MFMINERIALPITKDRRATRKQKTTTRNLITTHLSWSACGFLQTNANGCFEQRQKLFGDMVNGW